MQIRPGTPLDHEAVLEVYRQARSESPSAQRLERVVRKIAEELLVVADDDEVLGFAVAEPERADQGEGPPVAGGMHLSMVFVAAEHQRSGVGSALLEGVADLGWGLGYRTLSAWSSTPEFYEAAGLERTAETQRLPDGRTATRLTAELEAPVTELVLDGPGIRLGQLLKFAGLVDTGADAKALLAAEGVEVNGEVDTRRGRQLHDGDEVHALGRTIVLRLPTEPN